MSRPLLDGLIDDAALFPPGNAPMPAAVAGAPASTARPSYAELVGPFLCPASRVGELRRRAAGRADLLRVGLIAADGTVPARWPRSAGPGRPAAPRPVELPVEPRLPAATVAALAGLPADLLA